MAACVRTAWLTLGSLTVYLENTDAGWFCSELNLPLPDVREVVTARPDQDGVDDRTSLWGGRVVTANITAAAPTARIDDVADSFAPFMVPTARPVLHWILDRPGTAERTLTVRGSGYDWPIVGADERNISLQWLAADPVARDPVTKIVTSWSGSQGTQGRAYPLTFNRTYPTSGGGQMSGTISSAGEIPVRPLLRVYGPITGPDIQFTQSNPSGSYRVVFQPGYVIDAGHWVDVDCARRTALRDSDVAQPVAAQINWINTTWPVIAVSPSSTVMALFAASGNTTAVTQVQAIWQDGFLT